MNELEQIVSSWQGITVEPHRFGGREFRLGHREIGHVHLGGVVDIPFTVVLRDAAIAEGKAELHHYLPNSGWTTVRIGKHGLEAAVELLRRSYDRVRRSASTTTGSEAA
jgi:hypothetical protein